MVRIYTGVTNDPTRVRLLGREEDWVLVEQAVRENHGSQRGNVRLSGEQAVRAIQQRVPNEKGVMVVTCDRPIGTYLLGLAKQAGAD